MIYGCTSLHSRKLMLVYQSIGSGTVYGHLHRNEAIYARLTWDNRMNIAVETARALKYLHASNIVHRDINPNNILPSANLHVKLGDFRRALPFPKDQSRVETGPQGTLGYVDLKYCMQSGLTHKSNVFSFGVVMIELMSSLRAYDNERFGHQHLSAMATNKFENNVLDQLVDHTLGFVIVERNILKAKSY